MSPRLSSGVDAEAGGGAAAGPRGSHLPAQSGQWQGCLACSDAFSGWRRFRGALRRVAARRSVSPSRAAIPSRARSDQPGTRTRPSVIAASLLVSGPVVLDNLPQIGDVETAGGRTGSGSGITQAGERTIRIDASGLASGAPEPALASRIRGSFLLAAPLLARGGSGDPSPRRRPDRPAAHRYPRARASPARRRDRAGRRRHRHAARAFKAPRSSSTRPA